jgi:serpin B
MKKFWTLFMFLPLASCHDSAVEPDNKPNLRTLSHAEQTLSKASNDFAFSLFRTIREVDDSPNTFISPLSVSMALGMTLNGASPETRESILSTINFDDLTADEVNQGYLDLTGLLLSMDKKVAMGIANSVWYSQEYTASDPFIDRIEDYYSGLVEALDFSNPNAKNTINDWVASKTNDRIKGLIGSISPEEVMFLVNAIYFKGDWTYQFDKSKTHDAPFRLENGSTTTVNMMFAKKVAMRRFENENVLLLDVPYGNEQFRMTILLPDDAKTVSDIVADLNADQLNSWLAASDSISPEFELPKFRIEWKRNVKSQLESMGMKSTGFPGLFEEDLDLEITRVVHQTYLDVNEEGTEAAAATGVGVGVTSAPPPPLRITVDKPFAFFIREKHTGAILFMGQYKDPAAL